MNSSNSEASPVNTPRKRKRKLRSSSQPSTSKITTDNRIDVLTVEDDGVHSKLDLLITMVTEVKSDIKKLDNEVKALREDFLKKEEPITNVTLETLSNGVEEISKKLLNFPEGSTNLTLIPADIIPGWEEKISTRKFGYYKYIRNGDKYKIHQEWLNKEVPFIPPKYLPKKVKSGESDARYNVRKQEKLNKLNSDIDIYQVDRDEGKAICESIDAEISRLVNETEITGDQKQSLLKEYKRRIDNEELVSKKKWEKSLRGLTECPERAITRIEATEHRTYASIAAKNTTVKTKDEQWVMVEKRRKNRTYHAPNMMTTPVVMYPNLNQPPPPLPAIHAHYANAHYCNNSHFQKWRKPYKKKMP